MTTPDEPEHMADERAAATEARDHANPTRSHGAEWWQDPPTRLEADADERWGG